MRNLFLISIGVFVLFVTGCTTIPPGKVGIVVDQFGSNRGVQDYTTSTGFVVYNPISTNILEYPTFVQTYAFTANPNEGAEGHPPDESITFTDKNSVRINADISLSYVLVPEKVPAFYVKFRNDDISNFTFGYLHNVVRTAFDTVGGRYTVEDVMGNNGPFLKEVQTEVQSQVGEFGVQIQQLGFIGYPRPPQNIIDSINAAQQAKYMAVQKQNELLQVQADAAKQVAAAQGLAQANDILSRSITPQLLQKQQLDIQDRWINRWDGRTPSVTSGNNGNMLYQLPSLQEK